MNDKNKAEEQRRAKLLKMRAERLPDIKKAFEENQKRNFNANFAPGGKDEKLLPPRLLKKPLRQLAKRLSPRNLTPRAIRRLPSRPPATLIKNAM